MNNDDSFHFGVIFQSYMAHILCSNESNSISRDFILETGLGLLITASLSLLRAFLLQLKHYKHIQ